MVDRLDVVFCVPNLTQRFCSPYVKSMQETQWLLGSVGIKSGIRVVPSDCFVDKARNRLWTDFIDDNPECPNMFFIDDDIGWEPAKVVEFIRRPDPVVAGVYPKKSKMRDFPCSFMVNPENGKLIESQGMVRAVLAPTGFMRIKRDVVIMLAARASKMKEAQPEGGFKFAHYVFESGRGPDDQYWGEDYTFCKKLEELGIPIWVDPHITFEHMGTHVWIDRVADHLGLFRARADKIWRGEVNEHGMPIPDENIPAELPVVVPPFDNPDDGQGYGDGDVVPFTVAAE